MFFNGLLCFACVFFFIGQRWTESCVFLLYKSLEQEVVLVSVSVSVVDTASRGVRGKHYRWISKVQTH